jgi:hypothetical protein
MGSTGKNKGDATISSQGQSQAKIQRKILIIPYNPYNCLMFKLGE